MKVLSTDEARLKGLAIANRGICDGLSPDQLQTLEDAGEFRSYENEVVAADAEPLETLFYILRGQFEVSKADGETKLKITLATLGPEQVFGEMSFLSGMPASANVLAKGRVACWVLSHNRLRHFIQHQPGGATLAMNMATLLAQRVREGNTRLVGMTSTLSTYFGRAARLSKEKSLPAPTTTEHARLEIPTRVFDEFAREALELGHDAPLTESQREIVRDRIATDDLDLIPWLERGQSQRLHVRISFYEDEEEIMPVSSERPQEARSETTVLRVPQTQARIAPDISYIDRKPGKAWWLTMAASILLLPLLTAFFVVSGAPLDSRQAVVASKTFRAIPGHRILERVFIRRDIQTYPVTLAQDASATYEISILQPSDTFVVIESVGKRDGPSDIALRLIPVRPAGKILEELAVTIGPADATAELFKRRLDPGVYRLEVRGSGITGGPTAATISVRTEQ